MGGDEYASQEVYFQPRHLLCLAKQHEHPRSARRGEGELFFRLRVRHSQAIGVFVVRRFAIREQHVVMRGVAGNIVERELPDALRPVKFQRHRLPAVKRADHGDRHRLRPGLFRLPAENLAERPRSLA